MNRRTNPHGTKGNTDVTSGTESEGGRLASLVGRRRFLALGGAGAAALAGSVGLARAAGGGGTVTSPRSQPPVGLDPANGRSDGAVQAPPHVRHFALAGTDGWVSFPSADALGIGMGAAAIDPYFPDPLADPFRTTFAFSSAT